MSRHGCLCGIDYCLFAGRIAKAKSCLLLYLQCYNIALVTVPWREGVMPLVKRVTRCGNSAGLIFDQPVLRQVGLEIGSEVEVSVEQGRIILTPHRYATDEEARAAGQRVFERREKLMTRLASESRPSTTKRPRKRDKVPA